MFPSVPLFWPTVSIGIAGSVASLQNEDIYRDRLTGAYNRAFLQYVCSGEIRKSRVEMTGIMIDINGFKQINDKLGHNVGDQALSDAAHIMRKAVGDIGITIRYAGDEFVVLLNTHDERTVQREMDQIRQSFDEFNDTGIRPYQLSVSMGQYPLIPGDQSIEKFIAAIDHAMYEDKKRYHEQHPEADRRTGR